MSKDLPNPHSGTTADMAKNHFDGKRRESSTTQCSWVDFGRIKFATAPDFHGGAVLVFGLKPFQMPVVMEPSEEDCLDEDGNVKQHVPGRVVPLEDRYFAMNVATVEQFLKAIEGARQRFKEDNGCFPEEAGKANGPLDDFESGTGTAT